MDGDVYTISHEVKRQIDKVEVKGDDILALVDADGESCEPKLIISEVVGLRILLTTFPKSRQKRRWLVQNVHDEDALYIVGPWHWHEIAIASFVTSA